MAKTKAPISFAVTDLSLNFRIYAKSLFSHDAAQVIVQDILVEAIYSMNSVLVKNR